MIPSVCATALLQLQRDRGARVAPSTAAGTLSLREAGAITALSSDLRDVRSDGAWPWGSAAGRRSPREARDHTETGKAALAIAGCAHARAYHATGSCGPASRVASIDRRRTATDSSAPPSPLATSCLARALAV